MWLENPLHRPTPAYTPTGSLTAAWQFSCGGIFGSAVVADGIVYVGSRDGNLYALDDVTGKRLWTASVCPPDSEAPDPMSEEDEYYSSDEFPETGIMATPAVDNMNVYIGGLDGMFHAYDRKTGELRWETRTGGRLTSSPLLADDLVIVGSRSGRLGAMNRADGKRVWVYRAEGPINSSPAFADGLVVVGTSDGVVAIRASTGKREWRFQLAEAEDEMDEGGEGEDDAEGAGNEDEEEENADTHTTAFGRLGWAQFFPFDLGRRAPGPKSSRKFDSSPCIVGDRVYAASWNGWVVALRLSDGTPVWQRRVSRAPIFATPAVDDTNVYVATTGGMLVAIRTTGAMAWHAEVRGDWDRRAGCYASPVRCGPVLLVGCNAGTVWVVDPATGDTVSSFRVGEDYVHGTPTVTDSAIYATSEAPGRRGSRGVVVKLVSQPAAAGPQETGTARSPDVIRVVAATLKLLPPVSLSEAPPRFGGWERVRPPDEYEVGERADEELYRALAALADKGVISDPWSWRWGVLTRYQFASLLYKLLWEPNPFGVTLPEYQPADLDDYLPTWCRDAVPRVVGLGLMDAPNGRFEGSRDVTWPEVYAAMNRLQQLISP